MCMSIWGQGGQAGEKLGQWLQSTRLDLYPGKGLCGMVTSDDAGPGDHCAGPGSAGGWLCDPGQDAWPRWALVSLFVG